MAFPWEAMVTSHCCCIPFLSPSGNIPSGMRMLTAQRQRRAVPHTVGLTAKCWATLGSTTCPLWRSGSRPVALTAGVSTFRTRAQHGICIDREASGNFYLLEWMGTCYMTEQGLDGANILDPLLSTPYFLYSAASLRIRNGKEEGILFCMCPMIFKCY